MSNLRFKAIEEASKRDVPSMIRFEKKTSDYFGMYVFDRIRMRKYLPKETLRTVFDAIDKGSPLERDIANHVASGMRMWAMELGATHYSHWFHPLTEGTAEKHDAFIEPNPRGGVIEEFTGKLLAQQEPDASSFPSGGIRNTFEARGYTAWDPSSPAFIVDDTLCIPTIFISYTGEALDYKTPLLKSIQALDRAAVNVCRYFDSSVNKVTSFLGWEQEYFLVDEALYAARPDLVLTDSTLMGHESAKNQQLEDHYFGAIPARASAFMRELECECYKLGIPVKTRHNETAPNQFEFAPIYEEMNLAVDHNLLLMSTMKRVARRHHFRVIFHEKPFKGINGSGKHCNWSLGTDTGTNILTPGRTEKDNLMFVTFLVNVLMAVYRHNAVLKASIATAGNARRLGAAEAPPAIISVFLGSQISELLDMLEKADGVSPIHVTEKTGTRLSLNHIPEILVDNTDRNRTSPFAFTGNRFEFRATGASANCASAMIALNSAVAFQLQQFKTEVDAEATQTNPAEAVFAVLRRYIIESKPVRFDGNGYSSQWYVEAAARGLDANTCVPEIYDAYLNPLTVQMFAATGVLNETELRARNEVKWDVYSKKLQIESRVLGDLAMNHIIPVATRYEGLLLDNVCHIRTLYSSEKASSIAAMNLNLIEEIATHINAIKNHTDSMVEARKTANRMATEREKAVAYCRTVLPLFDSIRRHIDKLELIVDNEMWTLPKYREMLFLR